MAPSVSGRILNSTNGEPVPNATLLLHGRQGRLQTVSAANGTYQISGIPPGEYTLTVSRAGYLDARHSAPLRFDERTRLANIDLKLVPQGVVSGKVQNAEGGPLLRASVALLPAAEHLRAPLQRGGPGARTGVTNDAGEFRLAKVPPGKYYLLIRHDKALAAVSRSTAGAQEYGYAPTYYPAAKDAAGATVLTIAPGQEHTGLKITLPAAPLFYVRGRIEGAAPPASGETDHVTLLPPDDATGGYFVGRGGTGGTARVQPDGTFEVRGVHSGAYMLTLFRFAQGPSITLGQTRIEVSSAHLNNVVLRARPPAKVKGSLRFDGPTPLKPENIAVKLAAAGRMGGYPGTRTDANGAFELANIARDRFRIRVEPPAGSYLKSVTVGTRDALAEGIDLTLSDLTAPLQITLGVKPATLKGLVREGSGGTVWVFGANVQDRWSAPVDDRSGFSVSGLPPGPYRVAALATPELLQQLDREGLPKGEGKFQSVKLAEGETSALTLSYVTAQDLASRNP